MTEYHNVKYSVLNRVATISLNRPSTLNSFDQGLRRDLLAALQRAEQDEEVRILVLTGEGRAFSSGADLTSESTYPSFVEECEAEYKPFLMAVQDSTKLVVAAVNGVAAGISTALVLNCDLIIMAEDAYLYQAFSAIGLIPDGGTTQLLVNRLGYHKAIELVVDAGKLSAEQCLELGIANRIVPNQELRAQTQKWAEKLARGAALSQNLSKQIMRKSGLMTYAEVIDAEAELQCKCIASEDAKIGRTAFLNKQKPKFIGK